MKRKLTSQIIDAVPVPIKPVELRDAGQRGLVLRVQPGTGLRTWYFEYRLGGRKTRVKLGSYPAVPVTKARNLATTKRAELLGGIDPAAERKGIRESLTLRQFVDDHFRPWATANRKSGALTAGRIVSAFAPLLDRKIATLHLADFTAHRTIRKAQAGNKTLNTDARVLSAALAWGIAQGILKTNPLAGIKPEKEDARPDIRALTDAEEVAILAALPEGVDVFKTLFITALDTGCRRGELLSLDWASVDLDAGKFTVQGALAKSSQTRHAYLTPRCIVALRALGALYGQTGRVFSLSPSGVRNKWRDTCIEAGVSGVKWHHLRHTCGTRLALNGVALHVLMGIMGHSKLQITQQYLHSTEADKRAAMGTLAGRKAK